MSVFTDELAVFLLKQKSETSLEWPGGLLRRPGMRRSRSRSSWNYRSILVNLSLQLNVMLVPQILLRLVIVEHVVTEDAEPSLSGVIDHSLDHIHKAPASSPTWYSGPLVGPTLCHLVVEAHPPLPAPSNVGLLLLSLKSLWIPWISHPQHIKPNPFFLSFFPVASGPVQDF